VVRQCRRLPLIPHCSAFAAFVDPPAAAVREKECTSASSAVDGWEDVAVTAPHATTGSSASSVVESQTKREERG